MDGADEAADSLAPTREIDPVYGMDSAAWHGVAAVLLNLGTRPSWIAAWLLLEHVCAGLLFEPFAPELRAVWVHTEVVAAAAELEFAGLRRPRRPAVTPVGRDAPVEVADLRLVLEAAGEVLRSCVATAVDPLATARAVIHVEDALAAVDGR